MLANLRRPLLLSVIHGRRKWNLMLHQAPTILFPRSVPMHYHTVAPEEKTYMTNGSPEFDVKFSISIKSRLHTYLLHRKALNVCFYSVSIPLKEILRKREMSLRLYISMKSVWLRNELNYTRVHSGDGTHNWKWAASSSWNIPFSDQKAP